jgi:hypothetical protein
LRRATLKAGVSIVEQESKELSREGVDVDGVNNDL